jgi:hypothetical protein
MTRAEELRSQARALYDLAKATPQPDESLLHVLHAVELETHADLLECDDLPEAHVIGSRTARANRKSVLRHAET